MEQKSRPPILWAPVDTFVKVKPSGPTPKGTPGPFRRYDGGALDVVDCAHQVVEILQSLRNEPSYANYMSAQEYRIIQAIFPELFGEDHAGLVALRLYPDEVGLIRQAVAQRLIDIHTFHTTGKPW